jgi:hypothetical protein
MTRPAHPGAVVFVDEQAKSEKTLPVAQVPERIAWGELDGQPVAVVRVVAVTGEGRRELFSYAADGRLVSTTLQLVPR